MLRENKNFTGNDRFEGFCIDLLRRIATQIGFQYTIRLVPDHMYGVYDRQTKQWNGIVRELMERVSCMSPDEWTEKEGRWVEELKRKFLPDTVPKNPAPASLFPLDTQ